MQRDLSGALAMPFKNIPKKQALFHNIMGAFSLLHKAS
jgi:hypothetical protein